VDDLSQDMLVLVITIPLQGQTIVIRSATVVTQHLVVITVYYHIHLVDKVVSTIQDLIHNICVNLTVIELPMVLVLHTTIMAYQITMVPIVPYVQIIIPVETQQ
jgi:hypothetical protein